MANTRLGYMIESLSGIENFNKDEESLDKLLNLFKYAFKCTEEEALFFLNEDGNNLMIFHVNGNIQFRDGTDIETQLRHYSRRECFTYHGKKNFHIRYNGFINIIMEGGHTIFQNTPFTRRMLPIVEKNLKYNLNDVIENSRLFTLTDTYVDCTSKSSMDALYKSHEKAKFLIKNYIDKF